MQVSRLKRKSNAFIGYPSATIALKTSPYLSNPLLLLGVPGSTAAQFQCPLCSLRCSFSNVSKKSFSELCFSRNNCKDCLKSSLRTKSPILFKSSSLSLILCAQRSHACLGKFITSGCAKAIQHEHQRKNCAKRLEYCVTVVV